MRLMELCWPQEFVRKFQKQLILINYNKIESEKIKIMKNILMDVHELISYSFDGIIWIGKIGIKILEEMRDKFNKIDIDELIIDK